MKVPKLDKTELFNTLAAIAALILAGGDMSGVGLADVPEWAIPILLFVAVAVNMASRAQVKGEKDSQDVVEFEFEDEDVVAIRHPKVYITKKEMPGLAIGTRFQQSRQSANVYFYGIPISGRVATRDQVGIIKFESQYVENSPEWFEEVPGNE